MALDSIQGITIPKKGKGMEELLEDIKDSLSDGVELSPKEQAWYDDELKRRKTKDNEKKISDLQLKYNSPLIYKMKTKMTKTYDKYIANGQWFKASLKMFTTMGKKAGSWLIDILKFIFLLAIFDPKGKFLKSILKFILGMIKWFAKILGEYLPTIIAAMIDLIVNVLPPILKDVVTSLSDIIEKMFDDMIKKMPDGPMKTTMQFIKKGFGKDGIVTAFFSKMADYFPQILMILAGLKVISALSGPIMAVYNGIAGIIGFFGANGLFMKTFLPALIKIGKALSNFILDFVAQLIAWGIQLYIWIADTLIPAISSFLSSLATMGKGIWTWITQTLAPAIISFLWQLATWGIGIWTWITTTLAPAVIAFFMGFASIATSIWLVMAPLLPFILAAVALAAAIYLLWKYSDQVSDFFDGLFERFKKLGTIGKTIVVVLGLIFSPITLVIGAFMGLAKLFKSFKKIGVGNTFKAIGAGVMSMAKGAKEFLSTKMGSLLSGAKDLAVKAYDTTKKYVGQGLDWIKKMWDALLDSPFGRWISRTLDYIKLQFAEFMQNPLERDQNKKAYIAYMQVSKQASAEEAEKQWKVMKETPGSTQKWLDSANAMVGYSASIEEAVVKLTDAMTDKKQKLSPPIYIDKTKQFTTHVETIK